MRPVLFYVLDLPVYSYSLFVALAYLAGLGYAWLEARRLNLDSIHVIDASLWLFLSGIGGARLLFIIIDYKRFISYPLEVFKIWQGGLVFYGGLICAVAAGMIFLRRRRLPLWPWADLLAPTAMIALSLGRIGCFLNGCCYGKVSPNLPWGVVYPPAHPDLGLHQYPVHPAPLYESLAALLIFILLIGLSRRKRFHGEVFWAMALCYSVARFIIEFYRADPRGWVLWLSTSQAISVIAGAASVFFLVWMYTRAARKSADELLGQEGDRA